MQRYRHRHPQSPITGFEIADTYIEVAFQRGEIYGYSYRKPGKVAVERMKTLALAGRGLATYISKHVRDRYDWAKPARPGSGGDA